VRAVNIADAPGPWRLGVIRAWIGANEDQSFATVFLGSGLLIVAMYWAAAAVLILLAGELGRRTAEPAAE
jgi:hypothetical protein